MKKNLFKKGVGVLGAVLLLATNVMPGLGYVFADTDIVAFISGQGFQSIEAAIEAATPGDEIILNTNVELSNTLIISKKISLDLSGYSIKLNGYGDVIKVSEDGDLKIKDSSESGAGEVGFKDESKFNTSDKQSGTAIHSLGNLTINGGIYKGSVTIYVEGTSGIGIINGGDFYGLANGNVATIYASKQGTITINDGNFNGKKGQDVFDGADKEGKVIYAGANYNMCEHPDYSVPQGGTVIVEGGYFVGRISHSNGGVYELKGGNFDRNTVVKLNCNDGIDRNKECKSDAPKQPTGCQNGTLENIIVPGKKVVEESGRFIVEDITNDDAVVTIGDKNYLSIETALSDSDNGSTLIIMKDIEISSAIIINKKLTIDLNGHKILRNSKGNVITIGSEGNLIINDTSSEKSGELGYSNYDTNGTNSTVLDNNGGKFEINGGLFKGKFAIHCNQEGEGVINTGTFIGLAKGNVATIQATNKCEITINDGTFKGLHGQDVEGAEKEGKVIYAGGEANKCEKPSLDSSSTTFIGGTINVNGGKFEGRITHSNNGTYIIKGGMFDRNVIKKIDMDDSVCTDKNPNYRLAEGTFLDAGFLVDGYTMLKKGDNYVVELLADAATDPDNKSSVQIAEGTTITTGSTTVELNDIYDFLSGSTDRIKTGDNVSIPSSENGDILDAGNENLSIQGKLSLDFGETAKFSRPVAIRIAVNGNKGMRVKVKHNGGKFGFDGLTENAKAICDNGKASIIYQGGLITPINGYVVIYTCSASTFVAYTETAKVTPSSSSGRTSGGGSSTTTTKKDDKKDDTQVIELKGEVTEESTTTGEVKEENTKSDVIISDAAKAAYNDEQLAAYQWAYDNGITTINDADKARLSDPLTRAELAKMMSQYISSVLKKSPIKADKPEYKDVDESLGDLADFIVKAYQYQIMGINADGSALENFNPNGLVSRAEFATVFSRVLYGDKNNQAGDDYYSKHIAALKEAGILSNDNPTIEEVRGWVMLMMYRSVNPKAPTQEETKAEEGTGNNVGIANPASTYCVEQEGKIEIREDAEGAQYGVCKFKDGTEVEEWEYFRANHKDETTTGAVAESSTGAVAETTTGTVAENATGAVATTGAAENN